VAHKQHLHPWWAAGLLALAGALVYAGTLAGGYPLDDAIQVAGNVQVRSLSGALATFARPTWPGYVYRPLPIVTYALTYALVGAQPWLYHLTSVLLHAAATVLVYFVLRRVFADRLAAIAALLFAVHPAHVEAVASIANRTELLVAVLGLAGLLVVLPAADRHHRGCAETCARILFGSALFLGALLAKESAVAVILLLPLLLVTRKGSTVRGTRPRAVLRDAWPGGLAFAIALSAYLLARGQVLTQLLAGDIIAPIENWLVTLPPLARMTHAFALLGRYVAILLVPHGLRADYSAVPPGLTHDLLASDSLLYLALACGVVATVVLGIVRDSKALLFVGGWFLLSFAVTSNVAFPIGVVFADRLAYLPSVAVCAFVAWLLLQLPGRLMRVGTIAGVAIGCALLTVSYGAVWRDNRTLFLHELSSAPDSPWVNAGLGSELLKVGAYAAARQHFLATLRIYPKHPQAAHGLAMVELAQGHEIEGGAWLARALEIDPRFVPSLNSLGFLELSEGHVDEAANLFVRALNVDNDSIDAEVGILAATLRRGNLVQAAALRDQLLALDASRADLRTLSHQLDVEIAAMRSSAHEHEHSSRTLDRHEASPAA
jgi:tetratricopeptide (TPR) repeat protein